MVTVTVTAINAIHAKDILTNIRMTARLAIRISVIIVTTVSIAVTAFAGGKPAISNWLDCSSVPVWKMESFRCFFEVSSCSYLSIYGTSDLVISSLPIAYLERCRTLCILGKLIF